MSSTDESTYEVSAPPNPLEKLALWYRVQQKVNNCIMLYNQMLATLQYAPVNRLIVFQNIMNYLQTNSGRPGNVTDTWPMYKSLLMNDSEQYTTNCLIILARQYDQRGLFVFPSGPVIQTGHAEEKIRAQIPSPACTQSLPPQPAGIVPSNGTLDGSGMIVPNLNNATARKFPTVDQALAMYAARTSVDSIPRDSINSILLRLGLPAELLAGMVDAFLSTVKLAASILKVRAKLVAMSKELVPPSTGLDGQTTPRFKIQQTLSGITARESYQLELKLDSNVDESLIWQLLENAGAAGTSEHEALFSYYLMQTEFDLTNQSSMYARIYAQNKLTRLHLLKEINCQATIKYRSESFTAMLKILSKAALSDDHLTRFAFFLEETLQVVEKRMSTECDGDLRGLHFGSLLAQRYYPGGFRFEDFSDWSSPWASEQDAEQYRLSTHHKSLRTLSLSLNSDLSYGMSRLCHLGDRGPATAHNFAWAIIAVFQHVNGQQPYTTVCVDVPATAFLGVLSGKVHYGTMPNDKLGSYLQGPDSMYLEPTPSRFYGLLLQRYSSNKPANIRLTWATHQPGPEEGPLSFCVLLHAEEKIPAFGELIM